MEYSTYSEILKSIQEKAPIESGVQTLIYMLIFEAIKTKELAEDVIIIDKMQSHSVFMSYGGISDIAIVDKLFNYNTSEIDKIKMCIEIKEISDNIHNRENSEQVKRQFITYKNAIISNGKEWAFYTVDNLSKKCNDKITECKETINVVIENERKLAKIKSELRGMYSARTRRVKKGRNTDDIDIEIATLKKEKEKLEQLIEEKRQEIDSKIQYEEIKPKIYSITNQEELDNVCDKIVKMYG